MSFYDLGPLRFHSQLHTEVLWDIPSVYQKTLDPIWVSGMFYSACQKDRVFSCLWSLHLTRGQPPSFRPKWEYIDVYTEYTGKHDWIFEKMTHGCGHVLSSASYITLVSWEFFFFFFWGGATFRFVTLRKMFSEVFNVPRRYSYCFNNFNNIFFTTIWLYFF